MYLFLVINEELIDLIEIEGYVFGQIEFVMCFGFKLRWCVGVIVESLFECLQVVVICCVLLILCRGKCMCKLVLYFVLFVDVIKFMFKVF